MKLDNLSEGEQFIVRWQYHRLGGFNTALIECIAKADIINRAKLIKAFPVEVEAYVNYSENEGWWEKVKEKGGI